MRSPEFATRWLAIAASALVLAMGLAGCGGNKINEDLLPTALVDLKDPLRVKRLWSAKVGGSGESLNLQLRPVSDGTLVYAAGHNGEVHAFDARNGERRWSSQTKLPLAAGPGYGDERLAVGSNDGDLAVLNATDGTVLWQRNIGAEVLATPLIVGGLVVVRTVDGRLLALDVEDSIERWVVKREVPALSLRGNAAPAASGTRVVAGFDDGSVLATELRTGEIIWDVSFLPEGGRTVIDRLADIDADIRVVGDDAYVLGYQSQLALLSVPTGQIAWTLEISGHQRPGLDWSRIYITDDEGNVRSVDRSNGANRWVNQDLRRRKTTGPVTSGRYVVVGDFEGYLHWIDYETGLIVARERLGDTPISASPTVLDELVFVQTDSGSLHALALRDES
ncbi:MAG: outer membrane protein assembly factor BamB [Pseudomonadota bacterium]